MTNDSNRLNRMTDRAGSQEMNRGNGCEPEPTLNRHRGDQPELGGDRPGGVAEMMSTQANCRSGGAASSSDRLTDAGSGKSPDSISDRLEDSAVAHRDQTDQTGWTDRIIASEPTTPAAALDPYLMAESAAAWLRQRGVGAINAAIILGSGWGPADSAWGEPASQWPMSSVPGFRQPVAPGHAGQIRLYHWGNQEVLVLVGRTHLYEGLGADPVAHGVRVIAALGAKRLILTNASGSFNPEWPLGQVAVISDHLNFSGVSPLRGPRFVDLTDCYSPQLRQLARRLDPGLVEAVYALFTGPSFETVAEGRLAQLAGAELVGMSTVPEVIAARELGLELIALSTVTAHEVSGEAIDPDQVVAIAERSAAAQSGLLQQLAISD
jgi:purine-nucleoside phosphorylase